MDLLSPRNDLVFKLLLQRHRDLRLLRSMIEAVVTLESPIVEIELLNPEIPNELPADKPIILDVRALLKNRARVNIEMQGRLHQRLAERFVLYATKEFSSELSRGDGYTELLPVISILWLQKNLLKTAQFHSVFHLLEDTSHERFTDHLEIHTLELKKLDLLSETAHPSLYRWSKFLLAKTHEDFERLAEEDPTMDTARKTLEEISADPAARAKALQRELSLRAYYHAMASERNEGERIGRKAGRKEGRKAGRKEGRKAGLSATLTRQLSKRFGELPAAVTERIGHASTAELDAWLDAVLTADSLEEVFRSDR